MPHSKALGKTKNVQAEPEQIVGKIFKPRGSRDALEQAAAILAPFPTKRPPKGVSTSPRWEPLHLQDLEWWGSTFRDLGVLRNNADAISVCERIGISYGALLEEDNAAPRQSQFLEKLNAAE